MNKITKKSFFILILFSFIIIFLSSPTSAQSCTISFPTASGTVAHGSNATYAVSGSCSYSAYYSYGVRAISLDWSGWSDSRQWALGPEVIWSDSGFSNFADSVNNFQFTYCGSYEVQARANWDAGVDDGYPLAASETISVEVTCDYLNTDWYCSSDTQRRRQHSAQCNFFAPLSHPQCLSTTQTVDCGSGQECVQPSSGDAYCDTTTYPCTNPPEDFENNNAYLSGDSEISGDFESTNWTFRGGSGDLNACEFRCSSGYSWTGSSCVVTPQCGGLHNQNFSSSTTSWPNSNFCSGSGVSVQGSNPSFPAPGGSTSWVCVSGNLESDECSASRQSCGSGFTAVGNECVQNPTCGSRATNHNWDVTSWPNNDFCGVGSVQGGNPSFPAAGDSVSWTCENGGGALTESCSADREGCPSGFVPSGNDCVEEPTCGSRATTHNWDVTSWPNNNFCGVGSVQGGNPSYPSQGGDVSWTCENGGELQSCSADRNRARFTVRSRFSGDNFDGASITGSYGGASGSTLYTRNYDPSRSSFTLTAQNTPTVGGVNYVFSSWNNCNSHSGNVCTLTKPSSSFDSTRTVTANYDRLCSETQPSGTNVNLGADRFSSSSYSPTGWTFTSSSSPGACQWTCSGGWVKDGNSCTAPPQCGTRDGQTYNWDTTGWPSGSFCGVGSVQGGNPNFPSQGDTANWNCIAGDSAFVSCSADRNQATFRVRARFSGSNIGIAMGSSPGGFGGTTVYEPNYPPSSGSYPISINAPSTQEATDGYNYRFLSWSGGCSGASCSLTKPSSSENGRVLTVDANYERLCGGSYTPAEGLVAGPDAFTSASQSPQVWTYIDSGVPGICQWTCEPTYVRSGIPVRNGSTCIPRSADSSIAGPNVLYIPHRSNTVSGTFTATFVYNSDVPVDYRMVLMRGNINSNPNTWTDFQVIEQRQTPDLYSPGRQLVEQIQFFGPPDSYVVRSQYKYSNVGSWPNNATGVDVVCETGYVWNDDLDMCTECVYQSDELTPCCQPDGYFRDTDVICNVDDWICVGPGAPNTCQMDRDITYCSGFSQACFRGPSDEHVVVQTELAPLGEVCDGDGLGDAQFVPYTSSGVVGPTDSFLACSVEGPYCSDLRERSRYYGSCGAQTGVCDGPISFLVFDTSDYTEFCNAPGTTMVGGVTDVDGPIHEYVSQSGLGVEYPCNYAFGNTFSLMQDYINLGKYQGDSSEWCVSVLPLLFSPGTSPVQSAASCPFIHGISSDEVYHTSDVYVEVYG